MISYKTYRIAAISSNSNSFGLHSHMAVARDGSVYQFCRSRCSGLERLVVGQEITIEVRHGEPQFPSSELVRRHTDASAEVLAEVFALIPLSPMRFKRCGKCGCRLDKQHATFCADRKITA